METMQSDAHLHLLDLAHKEPDFLSLLIDKDWRGAAVCHDREELEASENYISALKGSIMGFGIHPQSLRTDTQDYLADLVQNRRIAFIGEAGFEFFGDRAKWVRNEKNLEDQGRIFEFQLALAIDAGLPLLIHSRKATDILLAYAPKLRRLRSLVFHGWPGRIHDAKAFLEKGINAYFSFGTPLLRQAAHGLESCKALPEDRLLSETDAPWQPPRGSEWTRTSHLDEIVKIMAGTRKIGTLEMEMLLRRNFIRAFGLEN